MPAGVVNGSRIKGEKRARMIEAFARGDSTNAIRRAFKCSWQVAQCVFNSEFAKVEQRKAVLAAKAERIADLAADGVIDDLRDGNLKGVQRATVFGIACDKLQVLRGEPSAVIAHTHSHTHQHELVSALNSAVQRIEKRVLAGRTLPDNDQQRSETYVAGNERPGKKPARLTNKEEA